MKKQLRRNVERGPGGYHTRLPANWSLTESRPLDGRAVGITSSWSGQHAAVLPTVTSDPQHCRIDGVLITVICRDEYISGLLPEVVAELSTWVDELAAEASGLPDAEARVAALKAEFESLQGLAAEGFDRCTLVPAVRQRNGMKNSADLAPLVRDAAVKIAALRLPMAGLSLATGPRRPGHNGNRDGVLIY